MAKLAHGLPSFKSRDYGAPFAEIFRRYGGDFYAIESGNAAAIVDLETREVTGTTVKAVGVTRLADVIRLQELGVLEPQLRLTAVDAGHRSAFERFDTDPVDVAAYLALQRGDEHHTRIAKWVALAVFASDAVSSTAYASRTPTLALSTFKLTSVRHPARVIPTIGGI